MSAGKSLVFNMISGKSSNGICIGAVESDCGFEIFGTKMSQTRGNAP